MLSNIISNVEDYLSTNTERKTNEYTTYPTLTSSQQTATNNINNFIGTFCPQGHYYLEKTGMISIQPSTVPVTSSSNVRASISNYNTENSSLETFVNVEDREDNELINKKNKQKYKNNFFREQIFILILFIIILLILFQKKYKLFTI